MALFRKLLAAAILTLCGFVPSFSQGLGTSVYSQFGLGDIEPIISGRSSGMAGVGVAMPHGNFINGQNPALLSYANFYTIYEFGGATQYKAISTSSNYQHYLTGNLSYVSMLFPVSKKLTINVGLRPYSTSNLAYTTTVSVTGNDSTAYIDYASQGGLNEAYFSNGIHITNALRVGVSMSYIFGTITKSQITTVPVIGVPDGSNYSTYENYRMFNIKPGISYRQKIKEQTFITLGVTADFSQNVGSNSYTTKSTGYYAADNSFVSFGPDTVKQNNAKVNLPINYTYGISIDKADKWCLGVDFNYGDWSKYKGFTNDVMKNTFKAAIGGEFTPNSGALKGYYKRIIYRAGAYYSTLPYYVNGQQIQEYAMTIGAGLPLRKAASTLNTAVMYGDRGTTSDGLIRESFIRVMIGVTINDKWFVRHKYD